MKYNITLADPNDDHLISQWRTSSSLRKSGFTKLKWNMRSGRKNGDSLHRWYREGNDESLLVLKLSADVEKIEKLIKVTCPYCRKEDTMHDAEVAF